MRKIKFRQVSNHYECGDGCCDEYSDTAYVTMDNGEEFEVDTTCSYTEMYQLILAKLGYEIEEYD